MANIDRKTCIIKDNENFQHLEQDINTIPHLHKRVLLRAEKLKKRQQDLATVSEKKVEVN